jgi:hypothetical protein
MECRRQEGPPEAPIRGRRFVPRYGTAAAASSPTTDPSYDRAGNQYPGSQPLESLAGPKLTGSCLP